MKQATLTIHEIQGRPVLANNGGKTLLQQMSDIKEDHRQLHTRVNRLESLGSLFIDVRERSFLSYLRDRWRQPHHATQVRSLNRSVTVHGGHAEADALMFLERRPADEIRQYVYLYGLNPTQIQDLASRGLRSTLKALSAVGGFHLDGKHLLADEEKIFEEIKMLVNDDKLDEAEEVSKGFPFQKGFIELDPIIEME